MFSFPSSLPQVSDGEHHKIINLVFNETAVHLKRSIGFTLPLSLLSPSSAASSLLPRLSLIQTFKDVSSASCYNPNRSLKIPWMGGMWDVTVYGAGCLKNLPPNISYTLHFTS